MRPAPPQLKTQPGATRLLLLSCVLCLQIFSLCADDRFPPYDNTKEVEAFWASKPEFFQFKTIAELPKDLKWETGADLPEIGDPGAKKGGTFHTEIPSFPPTFRIFGPDAGNTFRGEHLDNISISLVSRHPNEDKWIPGVAEAWAVSPDGLTVFYRLDPAATWSDGVPVAVEDFFMTFYVMLSPYIKDPWYNDYYAKEFKAITKYSDQIFSVTIPDRRPDPVYDASLSATPRHFFKEFTEDFPARYQWRKTPTTGAYDILPEDIKRGRSVTLSRVKNWWARDKKYYRYLFNADRLEYKVIGSTDKAWELFRQGKIDFFSNRFAALPPLYWYEKSEAPEFYNGYIEKGLFYNVYPRISRGIYLNQSKPPLDNLDVRLGINYSLNFQKVIDVILRGDAVRMQSTFAGFGRFTNPALRAIPYDVTKAAEHFGKAGYTKRGNDGILVNSQGKRLSLSLSCPDQALFMQACLMLKEEAVKAGLEIKLDSMDITQLYKKLDQKNHEMCVAGWGASPPYPRFWEYYHSDNAWKVQPDGTRKVVPDTNNTTMTADPAMDPIIDRQRKAETEEEMQKLCWELEEMVQAKACSIPAWDSPYYRYASWRWIRWPKEGNLKMSQLPLDTHVFWIDEERKKETIQAMKDGRSYGEVTRIYDTYREQ